MSPGSSAVPLRPVKHESRQYSQSYRTDPASPRQRGHPARSPAQTKGNCFRVHTELMIQSENEIEVSVSILRVAP